MKMDEQRRGAACWRSSADRAAVAVVREGAELAHQRPDHVPRSGDRAVRPRSLKLPHPRRRYLHHAQPPELPRAALRPRPAPRLSHGPLLTACSRLVMRCGLTSTCSSQRSSCPGASTDGPRSKLTGPSSTASSLDSEGIAPELPGSVVGAAPVAAPSSSTSSATDDVVLSSSMISGSLACSPARTQSIQRRARARTSEWRTAHPRVYRFDEQVGSRDSPHCGGRLRGDAARV